MQTRSCTVEKKTAETGSYIDPESVAVCFRSTGCRVSEQRPGNLYIEKLDQRSHKKGCDDRADADNRGYRGNASAARQIDDDSGYDTDTVCGNAAKLEFGDFPFTAQDNGDRIVG